MEKKALKYYQDKLFIGGLSFKTTDQSLEKYFSKYGPIKQANVMKYTDRQVSRGFGFCIFENPQSAELAMETKVHVIDGRKVDVRWALPKEMAPPPQALVEQVSKPAIRKIFVGGLSVDTHDSDLREYFSQFGEIESASVMYQHDKRHSRGFGFVLFKSSSSVNTIMQTGPHVIRNKTVDVKKAYPKDELSTQTEVVEVAQEPVQRDVSTPRMKQQSYSFNASLSNDVHPSPRTNDRLRRNDSKLIFFDELDNATLPSYQRNSLNSPLFNYGSGLLDQPPYDPYSTIDNDWNTQGTSFYEPYPYKQQSPSQFNSLSGEQDSFSFASTGGSYSRRNSLSFGMRNSLLPTSMEQPSLGTYQSRHDMPFLDSVGSAGSSRYQPFASQRSFIASDSGYDDLTKESPFFSNGGKMGSDLLDGGYGSRGLDNEYSGYSSHISHHHYDNSEGEDIDNIINESLGNRSFSKQRRSKNHLIFSSGTEEPFDSNPFRDGSQTEM